MASDMPEVFRLTFSRFALTFADLIESIDGLAGRACRMSDSLDIKVQLIPSLQCLLTSDL